MNRRRQKTNQHLLSFHGVLTSLFVLLFSNYVPTWGTINASHCAQLQLKQTLVESKTARQKHNDKLLDKTLEAEHFTKMLFT